MDIIEFLTARIDEDENTARAAGSGEHWIMARRTDRGHLIASDFADEIAVASPSARHHIVRWDPARVLAEVASKRLLLGEIERITMRSEQDDQELERPAGRTLRALASAYAEHPDFDPQWRLGE